MSFRNFVQFHLGTLLIAAAFMSVLGFTAWWFVLRYITRASIEDGNLIVEWSGGGGITSPYHSIMYMPLSGLATLLIILATVAGVVYFGVRQVMEWLKSSG